MKIGIIGTRGIPNQYGGFEQFAEYLAKGLVEKGMEVVVYCPHDHPLEDTSWHGIHRRIRYNPESWAGTAGQFIYDLLCILDCRHQEYDAILQLGYTSSAIWGCLLPSKSKIITNMDGIEYQRRKYSPLTKWFLRISEKLTVRSSNELIADSPVIEQHLSRNYHVASHYIPYAAECFTSPQQRFLEKLEIEPRKYDLVIARIEPDNHIDTILEAYTSSGINTPILVIGDTSKAYGRKMTSIFTHPGIRFLGKQYDQDILNNFRYFCRLYLHGHSVGGTNPSLLEAMACSTMVCAHDNAFNRFVLGDDAWYFKDIPSLTSVFQKEPDEEVRLSSVKNNLEKIRVRYNKELIINAYASLFIQ